MQKTLELSPELFRKWRDLISAHDIRAHQRLDSDALASLRQFGYQLADVNSARFLPLFNLAADTETIFSLQSPEAPGLVSVCAKPGGDLLGQQILAGCGENLRIAFEKCIGETAESMSFIGHAFDLKPVEKPDPSSAIVATMRKRLGIPDDHNLLDKDWIEATSWNDCSTVHFPRAAIVREHDSILQVASSEGCAQRQQG